MTRPTAPDKDEHSPEDAWRIWDGWARRERLRELRRARDRGRVENAAPVEDAAPLPEGPGGGRRALCRLCGRVIEWTVEADGKRVARDVLADGTAGENHARTCRPYLERLAAKRQRGGDAVEVED